MATAVAAGTPPPGATDRTPLDEVMLAMDVVDTLRHRERLVTRELDEELREQQLLERLRELYRTQGIDVPDRILEEGVRALAESRFTYLPPKPGFALTLARLWVTRARWGRAAGAGLAALLVVAGVWWFGFHLPAQRAAEALRIELSQTLPASLDQIAADIGREATVEPARTRAAALVASGKAAAAEGDAEAARAALASLDELRREVRLTYQIRIITPRTVDERVGVFRVPPTNPMGRNFYLIVEAIGQDGRPVPRRITNEEDGLTTTVTRWGVRVPARVYEAVRRDRADDGIIQSNLMAVKTRGTLEPEWRMGVEGGAITRW